MQQLVIWLTLSLTRFKAFSKACLDVLALTHTLHCTDLLQLIRTRYLFTAINNIIYYKAMCTNTNALNAQNAPELSLWELFKLFKVA
jgi:hypothetical protein